MRLLYDLNKGSLVNKKGIIADISKSLGLSEQFVLGILEGRRKPSEPHIKKLSVILETNEVEIISWLEEYSKESNIIAEILKEDGLMPLANYNSDIKNRAFGLLMNDIWQFTGAIHNNLLTNPDYSSDVIAHFWKRRLYKDSLNYTKNESINKGATYAFPFSYIWRDDSNIETCWVEIYSEESVVILEDIKSDNSMYMPEVAIKPLVDQILFPKGIVNSREIPEEGQAFTDVRFLMRTWNGNDITKPVYREIRIINKTIDINVLQRTVEWGGK
jgi:transcriptional regulator with XRE-family HTH domain